MLPITFTFNRFQATSCEAIVCCYDITANRPLKAVPSNPGNISFKALTGPTEPSSLLKNQSTLDCTEYVRGWRLFFNEVNM